MDKLSKNMIQMDPFIRFIFLATLVGLISFLIPLIIGFPEKYLEPDETTGLLELVRGILLTLFIASLGPVLLGIFHDAFYFFDDNAPTPSGSEMFKLLGLLLGGAFITTSLISFLVYSYIMFRVVLVRLF